MEKVKLGITPMELMGMIPELSKEAWGFYAPDKEITVDEGILLVAGLLRMLGEAADPEKVKAFFLAQGVALEALAPLLDQLIDNGAVVEPPKED